MLKNVTSSNSYFYKSLASRAITCHSKKQVANRERQLFLLTLDYFYLTLPLFLTLDILGLLFYTIFGPGLLLTLACSFFYLGLLFLNLAPSCSFSLFVCVGGLWSV